jgi:pyrroloquinoline-quinone synthase
MTSAEFFKELDARIAKYDLLCHPFYRAWSAGELTRQDLQEYAQDYYHHVEAFPTYLAEFGIRLDDGELRRAVLANMLDEKGVEDLYGEPSRPHSEMWLDFLEGMGGSRDRWRHDPIGEIKQLMELFHDVADQGTPSEALAAFYAYESQVPRVAQEKARGLKELYAADERTCSYFTLHTSADVHHTRVWKQQLGKRLEKNPQEAEQALAAAEKAAKALWHALDGIEMRRSMQVA